jgi:hypothetical protein
MKTKYNIDKSVLIFNLFRDRLKDYVLLSLTIVSISYLLPLFYYLIFYGQDSELFVNFLNDSFYSSICLILFPIHAVLIKYLWYLISKLIKVGVENHNVFGIEKKESLIINNQFNSKYLNIILIVLIPVLSLILAYIFLIIRNTSSWWGNNSIEYIGKIFFTLSLCFVFYQLICHNILGIKAIITLKKFSEFKPHINFWEEHNDYFFIGFQNIFITIIMSSLIHLLAIYSLYYFNYFDPLVILPYLIFFIIFLIFGPLFWYYPLFLVHQVLNHQKVLSLNELSNKIQHANGLERIQMMMEYEIVNKRKTWLTSIPLKMFTVIFILLQIIGIILSIWALNQK